MSDTYAGRATAHFGREVDVKVERQVPPRVAMPQAVAWAIVLAFAIAVVAMGAAPFVEQRYRVETGMAAAVALIIFFALVGTVRSMRGNR